MEPLASPFDWAAGQGAGPVARLMYVSQSNVHESIYAEVESIRCSALRHNEPAGVATALLYQSGWFAQWKEGPPEPLMRIMARVKADPRHHSLQIVHSSRGPRLLAGPWSTAVVRCAEPACDMARRVKALCNETKDGRQHSPQTVWRRLSTPMRHPGAARQSEPDAFQRVLVCAGEGVGSFDLVHWLAQRHREEVVHRRFAGAHSADVGTDYVDFVQDTRVLRVIAMARHGLALPLTRAFLRDYSHIVLLLSGSLDRDRLLLRRVAQACEGLTHGPELVGVGPDGPGHEAVAALAQAWGLGYVAAPCRQADAECWWNAITPLLAGWRHAQSGALPIVPLVD